MTKQSSLIITCRLEAPSSQRDAVIDILTRLRFVGEPLIDSQNRYCAGERFLDHITFLGCSPTFCLDPSADDFCSVEVAADDTQLHLFTLPGPIKGRCPHCRRVIDGAADGLCRWQPERDEVTPCPGCGQPLRISELDWRHRAAFANLWIRVWGIQPELAVPGDNLLDELNRTTSARWDYTFSE